VSQDEIELDLSKISLSKDSVIAFFKKYGIVFLVLIPVLLSAYIRLIPADLPITDDWAKASVENHYRNQITAQVRQQYPNLPDQNMESLVKQQYAQYYQQNRATIQQQIAQTSQQFKSQFQDENGYTYMPDIDPYTYLRYARNYIDHGSVGDEVRDGVQWDNHMVAPKGRPATSSPHPIVLAYLYKIMSAVNSKITLMQSATYFPIIFSALAVIPIFFIARMFAGNVGGFFAALMMAVNGAFLGRTTWGHADTDAYSILFAVLFVWFFFLAFSSTTLKKRLIYAALGGFTLGLFSWVWAGWWYIFDFVLATIGLYTLYLVIFESGGYSWKHLKENTALKNLLITSLLLVVASGVFVSLFTSPINFFKAPLEPIGFTTLKEAARGTLWPNVYTTVAELNAASFDTIINSIGGRPFFYLSLLGIVLLLFAKKDGKREHISYALLFILWYIGIFYASTKGIRFTMMLVPPLALALGAAIGIIYKKTTLYMQKMNISPKITGTILIIFVLFMFFPYMKGAAAATKNDVPIVNDGWYNSLTKIKQESAPDTIINSWWDFGHHFKWFADRAVTFDGASQNGPMAHWIGKVLLTSNEQEAVGILRMLDCGSNDAFETINEIVNDTPTTVKILYNIIVLPKSQAEAYLTNKGIPKEIIIKVLQYTHCTPPEDYFITSGDMVGKAAVWAHFGSWDFNKADIWINAKELPRDNAIKHVQKRLNTSEDEAKKIYLQLKSITNENEANAWIAPWPGYAGQQGCSKQNTTLICGGFVIDLTTKDVKVNTDKGVQKVHSLIYAENGNLVEKEFENGLPQSALLVQNGDSYKIILAAPELATSTFTKLFYYDGIGMKHFTKFTEEVQPTGDRIIVWKVQW